VTTGVGAGSLETERSGDGEVGRNSKKLQCRGGEGSAAEVFPAEKSGGVRRRVRKNSLGGGTRAKERRRRASEERQCTRKWRMRRRRRRRGGFALIKKKKWAKNRRTVAVRPWAETVRLACGHVAQRYTRGRKGATRRHTGSGIVIGIRCGPINVRAEAERK
jgi:hypothetical protein